MKKFAFIFFLLSVATYSSHAQISASSSTGVPQRFAFSSLIRDPYQGVLASQLINLQFTLHSGGALGPVVYVETDTVTTSPQGIFTVVIGGGSIVSGRFDSIPWESGNIWIDVAVDATGGTNFVHMSTTQFISQPYALTAGNGIASIRYDTLGLISIKTTDNKVATSTGAVWLTTGNSGTANSGGFIGTTDNTDVILKRMGAEGLRLQAGNVVTTTGKLGVGVAAPVTSLDVSGGVTLRDYTVNVNGPATITVGDHGLIFLNSTVATYQAPITLANGSAKGQVVIFVITGSSTSKGVRFVNNGTVNNTRLNTDGGGVNSFSGGNVLNLTEGNSITFVWTGTDWVQIAATIMKD